MCGKLSELWLINYGFSFKCTANNLCIKFMREIVKKVTICRSCYFY